MRIKINFNIKVNRVVKYFIFSDLALLSGWGFMEPVFSIFVLQKIAGATLETIGISAAIYLILKSVIQIPIANYLDRNSDEGKNLRVVVGGLFLASLTALSFVFIKSVWELYAVQALHAVALALYVPSWSGIFSRHLDKDRISFDWSLDSTVIGLAMGISGFFGAILANQFGFAVVFVLAAAFSFIGAFMLLMVPELVLPKKTTPSGQPLLKDHTPVNIDQR